MSNNWVVQNLQNALGTWNDKLAEVWRLMTMSPENFKGGYSLSGLPFVSADCNISPMPDDKAYSNTLIYGHHMQDGNMFAVLTEYENQDFYEKHKAIEFDRIYEDGSYEEYEYEIFSALKTEIGKGFEYYRYADVEDADRLNEYLENVERYNLLTYKRTVDNVSDLMTLSTCSYHVSGDKGRFVVVAVRE